VVCPLGVLVTVQTPTKHSESPRRLRRVAALAAFVVVGAVACSNASTGGGGGSGGDRNTQGVSDTEIKVGGLAALTGPLGNQYAGIFDGVESYLNMINAQGGVNGRKIVLVKKADDTTSSDVDNQQAQALNEQDGVFAVLGVATPSFGGGPYLASHGVPTFGWNVNAEWSAGPSLFGQRGSYTDFTGPSATLPWLVHELGLSKVAILAYTATQSRDCATGTAKSFEKFGIDVVLKDTSLPFGVTSLNTDVQKMKDKHVDFVTTCMDTTGNTLLSSTLKQFQMDNVVQYWPNGYDNEVLKTYADLMEGVYLGSTFVPFEAPRKTPGMVAFLTQLHKSFPRANPAEVRLAGWMDADLFVRGLRMLGDNVTRSGLVSAINSMTSWTAAGIQPPVNWTIAHGPNDSPDCTAFIKVVNGKFTAVLGRDGTSFVCWPAHGASITPIKFPTSGSTG
jgi:ABC-type branched-subunit amino acid transport system substrate-binding protein